MSRLYFFTLQVTVHPFTGQTEQSSHDHSYETQIGKRTRSPSRLDSCDIVEVRQKHAYVGQSFGFKCDLKDT